MLRVEGLSVALGRQTVLNDVNFALHDGEKVGLVGENGAGKTTLLRVIAGEIIPDFGEIEVGGSLRGKVGYVPQHFPPSLLRRHIDVMTYMLEGRDLPKLAALIETTTQQISAETDGKHLAVVLGQHSKLHEQYLQKEGHRAEGDILELLYGVGLTDIDLGQDITTLSGGQKSRLALARMLYEQSRLLLLDEPTNHIDEGAEDWLSGYLARSKRPILLVSHLPSLLDRVVSRILFIERGSGQVRSYPGNYSQFLYAMDKERERAGRERVKTEQEIKRYEGFIRQAPQSRSTTKHVKERKVRELKASLPNQARRRVVSIEFPAAEPLRREVLKARNVDKSFGDKAVLKEITFAVGPTDRLWISGPNGAGKTTLLRILAGQLEPDHGSVTRNPRIKLGWYQQEQESLTDSHTVLVEVRRVSGLTERGLRAVLSHFLFFANQIDQRVGMLSRGERARLALCKIILSAPNFLMLDEPTNHLDRVSRESLQSALASYAGAMIVVSHDVDFLDNVGVTRQLELPSAKLSLVVNTADGKEAERGKTRKKR